MLTKKSAPEARRLRRTTSLLVPWQTAIATLWRSNEQSLTVTPSQGRDAPDGDTSTPTTKQARWHCSSVTPFEARPLR